VRVFVELGPISYSLITAIITGDAPDPWVLAANDGYYLLKTTGTNVRVYYSKDMSNFTGATNSEVWKAGANQKNVWAPELHHIDGRCVLILEWG
jgi:arabinan endo-1,5-alpha-L-arabinosidase